MIHDKYISHSIAVVPESSYYPELTPDREYMELIWKELYRLYPGALAYLSISPWSYSLSITDSSVECSTNVLTLYWVYENSDGEEFFEAYYGPEQLAHYDPYALLLTLFADHKKD